MSLLKQFQMQGVEKRGMQAYRAYDEMTSEAPQHSRWAVSTGV